MKRKNIGSFATQSDREKMLLHIADDLQKIGMLMPDIYSLKPKHIASLVHYWQKERLSTGTIKNRIAAVRFVFGATNKTGILPNNDQLNIPRRCYKPTVNRAIVNPDFSKITDRHLYLSLQL